MASNELQQKLQQGIAAARSGNRALGRRLLLQVTQADPKNEQAWIWLASCVTTIRERRYCLEQVVDINPSNEIAQRALKQLGEPGTENTEESRPAPSRSGQPAPAARRRRMSTGTLLIYAGLAIVLVIVGLFLQFSQNDEPATPVEPTATEVTLDAVALRATLQTHTPTITNTPAPTNTPILVYNSTSLAPTLRPTFTPSPTVPPTDVIPTATPYPLSEMAALAIGQQLGQPAPVLLGLRGDGSGSVQIADNVREVAYDPTGSRVALVVQQGANRSELFVAPANDPSQAQQVTSFGSAIVSGPSWSPDGQQLVFVSTANGSEDLWYVSLAEPDRIRALTNTQTISERDPAWSTVPGSIDIIFAADVDIAASFELYRMELPRQGVVPEYERLTDVSGSSYDASWSPDGSRITFISDRRGDFDVYIADPDGSGAFLITFDDGDAEDRNPSFTPDGRFVVFSSNRLDDRFQVYVASLNGSVLTRITNSETDDIQFVYQPIPSLVTP